MLWSAVIFLLAYSLGVFSGNTGFSIEGSVNVSDLFTAFVALVIAIAFGLYFQKHEAVSTALKGIETEYLKDLRTISQKCHDQAVEGFDKLPIGKDGNKQFTDEFNSTLSHLAYLTRYTLEVYTDDEIWSKRSQNLKKEIIALQGQITSLYTTATNAPYKKGATLKTVKRAMGPIWKECEKLIIKTFHAIESE